MEPMPNRPARLNTPAPTRTAAPARQTAAQRGYDYRWQQATKVFLGDHPLCAACQSDGRVTEATCVDHVEPHRGDMAKFWDADNWQALCKRCHDRKTARGE